MVPFCQKCEVKFKGYINDETCELFLEYPSCGKIFNNFDFSKMTVQDLIDLNDEPKEGV